MSTSNRPNSSEFPTKSSHDDLQSLRTEIRKHESLYFENGNIVLLSLPTDGIITAFKVYKDFLMVHSPVFEGMLSIQSPPSVEGYDGVPLVRLHDKAEDLCIFLKAIYEPMTVPTKRDFYLSFDIVKSTFMLAQKYHCENLLKWMRNTLSDIWPKDLNGWDSCHPHSHNMAVGKFALGTSPNISNLPEPCSAIRLAREYDMPSILPAAFYHLHCLSLPVLGHGQPLKGDHMGVSFNPEPNFSHLSPDDFACFVRGNLRLQGFMKRMATVLPADMAPGCEIAQCSEDLQAEINMLRQVDDYGYLDGLFLLETQMRRFHVQNVLCKACRARYIELLAEHRTEIWNSLPNFFGLRA